MNGVIHRAISALASVRGSIRVHISAALQDRHPRAAAGESGRSANVGYRS
jgi:hypothetical protein